MQVLASSSRAVAFKQCRGKVRAQASCRSCNAAVGGGLGQETQLLLFHSNWAYQTCATDCHHGNSGAHCSIQAIIALSSVSESIIKSLKQQEAA